jgi:ferredoxin
MAKVIQARCTCGKCGACTTIILAALKREAQPPRQRKGVGAVTGR